MRIEERWPNQTVRRGLGKSQHGGASWGGFAGPVGGERGFGCVRLVGVAPRDRSCTRRDRSGGGAIALTRWGEVLLRSSARFGPVPLPHHYFWGVGQRAFAERGMGWVCLGTGWWRARLWLCASVGGGSAGQVLHSQGSLGRWGYRADALEGEVATIQCSFRPCPAAASLFLGRWAKSFRRKGNGMGLFGDRLVESEALVVCVCWWWLRGTGPALAGIAREMGLSR